MRLLYQWLKSELEKNSFDVEIPEMPDSDYPKIESWVSKLKETISDLSDTILIGHSVGCQTILRYLESLNSDAKVKAVILIAPWFHLQNLEDKESEKIAKPWLETPMDFPKIKNHISNIVCIFSDNDQFVPVADKEIFKELLGAKIIVEHEKGHFTEEDGVTQVPSVLSEILKVS